MTKGHLILKWLLYGACAALLLLLQTWVLDRITLWGVHPFIVPFLAVLPATLEQRRESVIYAFLLGLFCDMAAPGLLPCFYAVAFFLLALLCSVLSRRIVLPGFLCSLLLCTLSLAAIDLCNTLILLAAQRAVFSAALLLTAKELLLSLAVLPLVHLCFSRLRHFFATS